MADSIKRGESKSVPCCGPGSMTPRSLLDCFCVSMNSTMLLPSLKPSSNPRRRLFARSTARASTSLRPLSRVLTAGSNFIFRSYKSQQAIFRQHLHEHFRCEASLVISNVLETESCVRRNDVERRCQFAKGHFIIILNFLLSTTND